MTGTLINVGTVLAGGAAGLLVGSRFSVPLRQTLIQAVGLTTLVVGLQRALPSDNLVLLLASLALGGLAGELLRLESGIDRLAMLLSRTNLVAGWAPSGGDASQIGRIQPARGFVTASLLFCVGPMTVLGSFEDGLTGVYQTLAVKAALDGIAATLLASTLGWSVLLASATVLLYQGGLTLGAGLLRGLLTDGMIAAMTGAGGVLIIGIGLNILELTRIRVGNLLPALIVAPALTGVLARGGYGG